MRESRPRDLALVRAAAELWGQEQQEIAYLTRLFAMISLPYREPKTDLWERRNGSLRLTVRPGPPGHAYGSMPRLLMNFLSTQAVKTRSRDIVLGSSMSSFLKELGLPVSGGPRGMISRLTTQAERLFLSSMIVQWSNAGRRSGSQMAIASTYRLWNEDSDELERRRFPSIVRLSADFYDEVISNPVPVDLNVLRALRGSALRLDLYVFLTYRVSFLRRAVEIPWGSLRAQFGSNLADTKQGRQQFRRDFEKNLREVLILYPECNCETNVKGVVLKPSRTSVPMRGLRELGSG